MVKLKTENWRMEWYYVFHTTYQYQPQIPHFAVGVCLLTKWLCWYFAVGPLTKPKARPLASLPVPIVPRIPIPNDRPPTAFASPAPLPVPDIPRIPRIPIPYGWFVHMADPPARSATRAQRTTHTTHTNTISTGTRHTTRTTHTNTT